MSMSPPTSFLLLMFRRMILFHMIAVCVGHMRCLGPAYSPGGAGSVLRDGGHSAPRMSATVDIVGERSGSRTKSQPDAQGSYCNCVFHYSLQCWYRRKYIARTAAFQIGCIFRLSLNINGPVAWTCLGICCGCEMAYQQLRLPIGYQRECRGLPLSDVGSVRVFADQIGPERTVAEKLLLLWPETNYGITV